MKRSILLLSCLMTVILAANDLPFPVEPQLPRKISIGTQTVMTLTADNFEIVVREDASPAAKFAAAELADALGKVFGIQITPVAVAGGDKIAICPGDLELAAGLGIKVTEFDRDGFVIRTVGNNKILIIGRDDFERDPRQSTGRFGDKGEWATLFGAYDFLERFAGVRYYFPGELGTHIPRADRIALGDIDIYDRPDFLQRRFNDYDHNKRPSRRYPGYDSALNWLRNRAETIYIPNCHGLAYLGYDYRFAQNHPEYFALNIDGSRMSAHASADPFGNQVCFSSDIYREIAADAVSFLRNEPPSVRGIVTRNGRPGWNHIHKPGMPFFNIMPNDCAYLCRCEQCQAHFTQGPQEVSNCIWEFFNSIAREVKNQNVPGFLTTMAYADYRMIPTRPIEDNILVMLAIRGPWNEFIPAQGDQDIALLRNWYEKLGRKTWLWTYPGKYFGHMMGIPHTTPRALGSFIKRAKPYIFGLYIECESDIVMFNYLTYYIFGKLAWDPDADVDQLLTGHANDLYGPAAAPMKEFFESIERNWSRIASHVVETSAGPKTVYPSELVLWNEIYSPAELQRLTGLFDQAVRLAAGKEPYISRIELMRQEMLQPILDEAAGFAAANEAVQAWNFPIRSTSIPVTVDGNLNDPAWRNAPVFHLSGLNGAPAEVSTAVRVLYDAENIYFAFESAEPETAKMQSHPYPFDTKDIWRDSDVEIFLSPDGDRRHCYQLQINPAGSVCDLEITDGGADFAWNSGAEVKTSIVNDQKWIAEVRLPRSAMRPFAANGILANFARHRVLEGVQVTVPYYCWSPLARKFGDVSRFGMLTLQPSARQNLFDNPDFHGEIAAERWLRRKGYSSTQERRWWSPGPLHLDNRYFLTGGASIRLDGTNDDLPQPKSSLIQYLENLKPDTEYELSFFLRMDDVRLLAQKHSGFYIRVDTGNRNSFSYPKSPLTLSGSCPWRRFSFRFKTAAAPAPGSAGKCYVAFSLRKASGSVWIDHVELYGVK